MSNRKRSRPVGLAGLLTVLTIGTIGIGNGLWAKTLSIVGTINTGQVDAVWTTAFCTEFHTWPNRPLTDADLGEAGGKDVGSLSWETTDQGHTIRITVLNGYPSYAVDCKVGLEVRGTIPVILRGIEIRPILNLSNCTASHATAGTIQTHRLYCDELRAIFTSSVGVQLDIPAEVEVPGNLRFHVEQPADQNGKYVFEVYVCAGQWNEDVSAETCFAEAD